MYDRALRDLETGKATANTELQGIGRGVLEDIVGDINTRRQGSLDSAAAWDFGLLTIQLLKLIAFVAMLTNVVVSLKVTSVVLLVARSSLTSTHCSARQGTCWYANCAGCEAGSSALLDTFANEATRNNQNIKANEGIF